MNTPQLDRMELRPSVRHSVRDMIHDDRRAAKRITAQAERFDAEGRPELAARYRRRAADRLSIANVLALRYLSAECRECHDEYNPADLQFGICDSCDNEDRGLCACGAYPGPNRRQCKPCAAEDEADALFHADR